MNPHVVNESFGSGDENTINYDIYGNKQNERSGQS